MAWYSEIPSRPGARLPVERAEREISDVARRLRQGTLFAVPKEQLSI